MNADFYMIIGIGVFFVSRKEKNADIVCHSYKRIP